MISAGSISNLLSKGKAVVKHVSKKDELLFYSQFGSTILFFTGLYYAYTTYSVSGDAETPTPKEISYEHCKADYLFIRNPECFKWTFVKFLAGLSVIFSFYHNIKQINRLFSCSRSNRILFSDTFCQIAGTATIAAYCAHYHYQMECYIVELIILLLNLCVVIGCVLWGVQVQKQNFVKLLLAVIVHGLIILMGVAPAKFYIISAGFGVLTLFVWKINQLDEYYQDFSRVDKRYYPSFTGLMQKGLQFAIALIAANDNLLLAFRVIQISIECSLMVLNHIAPAN